MRTVEILPGEVVLIDQLALPQQERYVTCRTWREVADRISDMTVRGAPAIGVTAAGGIALAAAEAAAASADDPAAFRAALEQAASGLLATRPTAVNLRWALDEMRRAWEAALAAGGRTPRRRPSPRRCCRRRRPSTTTTSTAACASASTAPRCSRPATASSRTATPARSRRPATARRSASSARPRPRYPDISVWVDETRPWLQGARLTAWELQVEGIPYRLISDNMAGYFMRRGEIDGVVVGADRIAANGDTANKIGTYSVSVLAKEHGIPFYVAAPLSTVDLTVAGGDDDPHRGARPERGHLRSAASRSRPRAPSLATPPSTSRRPPTSPPSSPRPACCGRRSAPALADRLRRRGVPAVSAQPPVRAYLMAAGLGTRLYPLTGLTSKPMVPILNRPVMEHLLHLLRRHGVTEIAANLHYHPEKIRSYFGDGAEFGVELRYNLEEHLLGTAGGADAFREFLSGGPRSSS